MTILNGVQLNSELFNEIDWTYKEFKAFLEKHNISIENFYYRDNVPILKYSYIHKDMFVIDFFSLSKKEILFINFTNRVHSLEKMMLQCIQNQDFEQLYCLINKPYRLIYFKNHFKEIPEENRMEILKYIYSSSECNFEIVYNTPGLKNLLIKNKGKEKIPCLNENTIVTIYRGENMYSNHFENGSISWTLDLEVAEFFAKRFNPYSKKIYIAKVKSKDILAYIKRESEVLVFPEDLINPHLY